MIIFIHYPIADARLFVPGDTGRLNVPFWPSPVPYREFVRSFGVIKIRGKGGIKGWIGENEICDARRALKFRSSIPPFIDGENKTELKCSARHFHFDGLAVGQFKVVFLTRPSTLELRGSSLFDLMNHILGLGVTVSLPKTGTKWTELSTLSKPLAMSYLFASTSTNKYEYVRDESWIMPGLPMVFLECNPRERIQLPGKTKSVSAVESAHFNLTYLRFICRGNQLPVWFLQRKYNTQDRYHQDVRTFRSYLMRLHVEKECLKNILRFVERTDFGPSKEGDQKESTESFFLQHYLNESTRRLFRIQKKTKKYTKSGEKEIAELAYASMDYVNPGQTDSLLQKLQIIRIRPQIRHKVEHFVNQLIIKEQIMGDKYIVGQAGTVGPQAKAHHINLNQVWENTQQNLDLSQLAEELSNLRLQLDREETELDDHDTVGVLARAEAAAKAGDGPKALQHLARAGNWALKIAEKIGAEVATKAIKLSLGL